jgi:hypothetical protein
MQSMAASRVGAHYNDGVPYGALADQIMEDTNVARYRATFDERLIVPLHILPDTVRRILYSADGELEKRMAYVNHLRPDSNTMLEGPKNSPDVTWIQARIDWFCSTVVRHDGKDIMCGKVRLAIIHFLHSHHNSTPKYRWQCIDCSGKWNRSNKYTRMATLYSRDAILQILLPEPDDALVQAHISRRVHTYTE